MDRSCSGGVDQEQLDRSTVARQTARKIGSSRTLEIRLLRPFGYRRRRGGRRLCGLTLTVFFVAMCVHLLRVTLTVVLTRTGTVRVLPLDWTVIRRVWVRVVVVTSRPHTTSFPFTLAMSYGYAHIVPPRRFRRKHGLDTGLKKSHKGAVRTGGSSSVCVFF